jgi:hypothetical protein
MRRLPQLISEEHHRFLARRWFLRDCGIGLAASR